MRFSIIIIILFATRIVHGQSIKDIDSEDGLPDARIYKIVQDSIGFIWMATEGGIVRYDGQSFRIFGLKDGLTNPDVWEMDPDVNNRLWFSTKGMYQGYIQNEKITTRVLPDSSSITPLPFWTDSGYVITYDGLYYRWGTRGWYVSKDYRYLQEIQQDRFGEYPSSILYVPYQFFLFYTGGRLYQYNLMNNKMVDKGPILGYLKSIDTDMPRSIRFGSLANDIYFSLFPNGILIWDNRDKKIKFANLKNETGIELGKYSIPRADGDGLYITGAHDVIFLDRNLKIKKTETRPNIPNITSYFKDRDDGSWFIAEKKVYYYSSMQKHIQHFQHERTVTDILLRDDDILITVDMEGVKSIDKTSFKVSDIGSQNVYKIFKGIHQFGDNIYIQEERNIFKLTPKEPMNLVPALGFIYSTSHKAMTVDSNYIYSGDSRSLHKYSKDGDIYFEFNHVVKSMALLHDTLYIGATDGLYYLANGKVNSVPSLPKNLFVNSLYPFDNGLMIGTKGNGLMYFKNSKYFKVNNTDEYFINQVFVDSPSTIWAATNKGVARIQLENNELNENAILTDVFTQDDGIRGSFINDVAVEDSILYVASNDGVSILNWVKAKDHITSKLYMPSEVHIPSDQREFYNLEVSVIDYVRSEHLNRAYKIGKDGHWIPFNEDHIALTNLDDGTHKITVRVTDLHGHEVMKVTTLKVQAFWHESSLFRFLLALFLFSGTAAIAYYITRGIERKRTLSIDRAREKVDLQLRSLRSQMNPHFVFNSLNAIQYYIFQNDKANSELYLTKFAHLIRQFFEYSNFDRIKLSEELELIENYLHIEQLRFEEKLTYSILVDAELDQNEIYIPSMLLQPLVENALIHGIFHKDGDGTITVRFNNLDEQYLQVKIEDDGVGYGHSNRNNHLHNPNRKYRSTEVLKSRIALLNKQIKDCITYDISEITEDTSNHGTRVTLTLKKLNSDENENHTGR